MAIMLRPELEEIIRKDVERGAYANADEYLEEAIRLLHGQETYLLAHRDEIAQQIEEGLLSAEQEGLIEAEELRKELAARRLRAEPLEG